MPIMTSIETTVSDWLLKKTIDFNFQSQLMGGFYNQFGDEKVNFELPDPNILLRIQGVNAQKTNLSGKDVINKERLIGLGYTVVDCWESDIKDNKEFTLSEAMKGKEI